jgi:hypothetical protein
MVPRGGNVNTYTASHENYLTVWNNIGNAAYPAMIRGARTASVPAGADDATLEAAGSNGRILSWRSNSTFASLRDGTSNVILVGEKHIQQQQMKTGQADGSVLCGDVNNTFSRRPDFPLGLPSNDNLGNHGARFGSFHPGVVHFALADGAVRAIPRSINSRILCSLVDRNDGFAIPTFPE